MSDSLTSADGVIYTFLDLPLPESYSSAKKMLETQRANIFSAGQNIVARKALTCETEYQVKELIENSSIEYDRPAVYLGALWNPKFLSGQFQIHNMFPTNTAQRAAQYTPLGLTALKLLGSDAITAASISKRAYKVPKSVQKLILQYESPWIKSFMAVRPDLDKSFLTALSSYKDAAVRLRVAQRLDLPAHIAKQMLGDENINIINALACNQNLSDDIRIMASLITDTEQTNPWLT